LEVEDDEKLITSTSHKLSSEIRDYLGLSVKTGELARQFYGDDGLTSLPSRLLRALSSESPLFVFLQGVRAEHR
jgi:hypothetical protein